MVWNCTRCHAENGMSHKWCGKCATAWWKTSHDATGKGKGNRSGADVAKIAANKAAQMTDTCEQVHVGTKKDDLPEMKAKLSTALAAKEALMIGPHSTDIANRLDWRYSHWDELLASNWQGYRASSPAVSSTGMTPPIRNMFTNCLNALKSGCPWSPRR